MKQNLKLLLCLLICASLPATSYSTVRTWTGLKFDGVSFSCLNEVFSQGSCWESSIAPSSVDEVLFDGRGQGSVKFDASSTTNQSVQFLGNGSYNWQLGSNRYNATNYMQVYDNTILTLVGNASSLVALGGEMSIRNSRVSIGGSRLQAEGGIDLRDNAQLFSTSGFVGSLSTSGGSVGSLGDISVSDIGSKWDVTEELTVLNGRQLIAFGGGFVDVGGTFQIFSSGIVDTRGGGLIEAGNLTLADNGLLVSISGFVGTSSSASGSVISLGNAIVTGTGSEWDTGTLTVTGRQLTASSGGFVDVVTTLTIQSAGSVVATNSGFVDVGGMLTIQSAGRADTTGGGRIEAGNLRLSDNGSLLSTSGFVGASTSANGSANSIGNATVTGTGSRWKTGTLSVLSNRQLTVSSGGVVDVDGLLNITSAGRVDTTGGGLIVADSLRLSENGSLLSTSGVVGPSTGDNGSANSLGHATVTGTGSQWDTGALIIFGNRQLTASSGGFVDVGGALEIRFSGRADTTGGGRIEAGSLTLSDNGSLLSTSGLVGASTSANGSANSLGNAAVTGTGSRWNTGTLSVLSSRQLTVSSDGFVDVDGLLNITSAGRVDTTGGGLIVADSLRLSENGSLLSTSGVVGPSTGDNGSANSLGHATVTGTGSQWDTGALIIFGNRQLTASSGGFVDVGGALEIRFSGRADTTGGGRIEAGSLTLSDNGSLLSTSGLVGASTSANGSANSIGNAAVTGTGSRWNTGTLSVLSSRQLTVSSGGLVDVVSTLDVNGGGDLQVVSATVNAANLNVTAAGSLLAMTAATINADLNITNASLSGTGIINGNVTGIDADIGPGNSPGLLTIDGNFSVDSNSSILFELGGLLAESEYDLINVTGTAYLAGELVVDLFDLGSGLFSASEGDVFDILTAETIIGSFDLLTLAGLSEGLGWDLSYLTDEFGSTDVLRLSVIDTSAVPVPAAVWLFGSGLLGLIGVARRKQI